MDVKVKVHILPWSKLKEVKDIENIVKEALQGVNQYRPDIDMSIYLGIYEQSKGFLIVLQEDKGESEGEVIGLLSAYFDTDLSFQKSIAVENLLYIRHKYRNCSSHFKRLVQEFEKYSLETLKMDEIQISCSVPMLWDKYESVFDRLNFKKRTITWGKQRK